MANHRFTSQAGGFAQRKPVWGCLVCATAYAVKQSVCFCSGELQYFASSGEFRRWQVLRQELAAGVITNLELQPRFPLVVNGQKIGVYPARRKTSSLQGEDISLI